MHSCILEIVVLIISQIVISCQEFNHNKSSSFHQFLQNNRNTPRIRQLQQNEYPQYDSDIHLIKIHGNVSLGYYYIDIFVGTPPQKLTVVIDTGSGITAFPCDPCNDCPISATEFVAQSSNTSQQSLCNVSIEQFACNNCSHSNQCLFNIDYFDGSHMEGAYFQDTVLVGEYIETIYDTSQMEESSSLQIMSNIKVPMTFGCTTKQSGNFMFSQADGIMGLGISTNAYFPPSILDFTEQYFPENGLDNSVALCLGNNGGYMTVGGFNLNLHQNGASIITVQYNSNEGQFGINVFGITLGEVDLGLTQADLGFPVIPFLDSGTTYTYMPLNIFETIANAMFQFCYQQQGNCNGMMVIYPGNSNCWIYDSSIGLDSFFATFPKIKFKLDNGQMFIWEPSDYLQIDEQITYESNSIYCLTALPLKGIKTIILGATFMQNYDIYFDKTNQQIKLTRADCSQNYNVDFQKFLKFDSHFDAKTATQQVNGQQSTPFTKSAGFLAIVIVIPIIVFSLVAFAIIKIVKKYQRLKKNSQQSQLQANQQISIPIDQLANFSAQQFSQKTTISDLELHQNYTNHNNQNIPENQFLSQNPNETLNQKEISQRDQIKEQFQQSQP